MKKIILLLVSTFAAIGLFAQCDELFISEYMHGLGNNRALELYNPTNTAIDLSAYSVGRFSNGSSAYAGVDLPADMIEPYSTYMVVMDKRDPDGTGLEVPIWNGFHRVEACTDFVTGEPWLTTDGDTIYCVPLDSTNNFVPYPSTTYNEIADLEGTADVFVCPVYAVNRAFYFNGNDAVALVKGSEVNTDGSNLLDVVGVVGIDPGDAGWLDNFGDALTRRSTLQRKSNVTGGTGIVAATLQDTFAYDQYLRFRRDKFDNLGTHECECDPDFVGTATTELNKVAFNMYPNPTSSELWIEAAEDIERVEIYNLLGERMLEQNFGQGASNKINLSVEKFETGMYVMSLFFEGNQQSTQKFIKR